MGTLFTFAILQCRCTHTFFKVDGNVGLCHTDYIEPVLRLIDSDPLERIRRRKAPDGLVSNRGRGGFKLMSRKVRPSLIWLVALDDLLYVGW